MKRMILNDGTISSRSSDEIKCFEIPTYLRGGGWL